MNRWIVFLRGVNVGGNNKLPMKALRTALEAGGFEDVETYIQSGNLVFSSSHISADAAGTAVTTVIETTFGFAPRSHTLSAEDLSKIINTNPYRAEGLALPKSVHFFFLAEPAGKTAKLDALEELKAGTESFELTPRAFYLHAPDGIGRSRLVAQIEKYIPVPMTARNMRSVYKVAALAGLEVEDI